MKRITIADKALRDKACNITKNPKNDGYQRAFASLFYKFFDKKTLVGTVKSVVICYEELAEELKKEMYTPFMDNIWGPDFKRIRFFYMLLIFIGNMHRLFL